jgi:hypothetical protein
MSVDIYPIHPETLRPLAGAPRCNFANTNARDLLVAVGLGSELWGEIAAAEVSTTVARCNEALAHDAQAMLARSGMVRETEVEGRLTINGSSDGRARERVAELREVLRWAVEHRVGVVWC